MISSEVGQETVYIEHATVLGETEIYGGGKNSIHFNNSVLNSMKIAYDKVRIIFDEASASSVKAVEIESSATLEGSENAKIEAPVSITGEKSQVSINIPIKDLIVDSSSVLFDTKQPIERLIITEKSSENTKLNLQNIAEMIQINGGAVIEAKRRQPVIVVSTDKPVTIQAPAKFLSVKKETSSLTLQKNITNLDLIKKSDITLTEGIKIDRVSSTANANFYGTGEIGVVITPTGENIIVNVPDETKTERKNGYKITIKDPDSLNATIIVPNMGVKGEKIPITIIPDSDYFITKLLINGTEYSVTESEVTFDMLDENVEIVAVSEKIAPKSIKIKKKPNKTKFILGEELDLNGAVFTVTMNNNKTQDIPFTSTDFKVNGYDNTKLGAQKVTISYKGIMCDMDIKVVESTAIGKTVFVKTMVDGVESTDVSAIVKNTENETDLHQTKFEKGDIVEFKVSPPEGYKDVLIYYEEYQIGIYPSIYSFKMPDKDVTITIDLRKDAPEILDAYNTEMLSLSYTVSGSNVNYQIGPKRHTTGHNHIATEIDIRKFSDSQEYGHAIFDLEVPWNSVLGWSTPLGYKFYERIYRKDTQKVLYFSLREWSSPIFNKIYIKINDGDITELKPSGQGILDFDVAKVISLENPVEVEIIFE